MTLDELFEIVDELNLNGELVIGSIGKVLEIESDGYGDGHMSLNEAWEDFKEDINTLKEAGVRTSYDDNVVPDRDNCAYTIVVRLEDNQ
jgi:hypothetical protein